MKLTFLHKSNDLKDKAVARFSPADLLCETVVCNMKKLTAILFILISLYSNGQNETFQIFLHNDTLTVNNIDTIFRFKTKSLEIFYKKGYLDIKQNNGITTTYYFAKIVNIKKDSFNSLPIAELVAHGKQKTIDNSNGKIILEGNLINGKRVGVWYDRRNEFDIINVFDSTGIQLPLIKFDIDTSNQLIYINEIDTTTFKYSLKRSIKLIVNPENYFKSKSNHIDYEDTSRFCILNLFMDTLDYESWKNVRYDFIRFIWFKDETTISLNIKKKNSKILYNLIVTDGEYDINFGNIIQRNSITSNKTKEFIKVEKEFDRMNFWEQISKDECYGDYMFVEVKIKDKYNSKRINCLEYKLPENKKIMKIFKKLSNQVGLKNDY